MPVNLSGFNNVAIKVVVGNNNEGRVIGMPIANILPLDTTPFKSIPEEFKVSGTTFYTMAKVQNGTTIVGTFGKVFKPEDIILNVTVKLYEKKGSSTLNKVLDAYEAFMLERGWAIQKTKILEFFNKNIGKNVILFEDIIAENLDHFISLGNNGIDITIDTEASPDLINYPSKYTMEVSKLAGETGYPDIIEYIDGNGNPKKYFIDPALIPAYYQIATIFENANAGLNSKPMFVNISGMTGDGKTAFAYAMCKAAEMAGGYSFAVACSSISGDTPDAFFLNSQLINASSVYSYRKYNGVSMDEFISDTRPRILFFDELSRALPSAINGILSLLDDSGLLQVNGEQIPVGNNLIIIATNNEGWEYSGVNALDVAVTTRQVMNIPMPLLTEESAKTLTKKIYPETKDFNDILIDIMKKVSKSSDVGFFGSQRIINNAIESYKTLKNNPKIDFPIAFAIKNAFSVWFVVAQTMFGLGVEQRKQLEVLLETELTQIKTLENGLK